MVAGDGQSPKLSAEAAVVRAGIVRETVDPAATIEQERAGWEQACAGDELVPGCAEDIGAIAGVAGRTITPPGGSAGDGILVYVHGGGLIAGSSITHRWFASRLACRTGRSIVLVDYRRLPEHTLDEAIADVVTVVLAVADSSPVILAGDSSGSALALTAALRLGDKGYVSGLVSFSGAFDATLASPSIDSAADPQLSREVLAPWQARISAVVELADPALSPLFAPLGGAPPTLLLTGADEVWRDDSIRLADRLRTADVPVSLIVVRGMWHCWPFWGEFPEADAALDAAARFVTACLTPRAAGAR